METNKLETIVGRLGSNPKLAYSKKLEPVCEFAIALYDENGVMIWKKVIELILQLLNQKI